MEGGGVKLGRWRREGPRVSRERTLVGKEVQL